MIELKSGRTEYSRFVKNRFTICATLSLSESLRPVTHTRHAVRTVVIFPPRLAIRQATDMIVMP
ncbi:hypothetical protein NB643_03075 [Oxalobacter aliiformigenes]|uniref:hypothetical protein n=1 Tax=Oxalobacter aliiformigenes TaxID=2946593 RepID=UPI0022AFA946|nr:hypothetical protein [Oxalobacter aliiformigenes]WAV92739.1 hypothetical protein NB641_08040 [Oxalobacter aliiformigenes]WAV95755.1 hypothetical protein NB643_03075 [Oxalobacter aliiformigenes]